MADKGGEPVLRYGRPAPKVGEWLEHEGPIKMCETGLHASRRIIDALQYAPGPWCAVVEIEEAQEQEDKLVCRKRKIIKIANVEKVLREFAVQCAVMAMERAGVTEEACWQAVDIKIAWLEGCATDEDLDAARDAAWAAAWAAARNAAWDAARNAAWNAENEVLESMVLADMRAEGEWESLE